MSLAQELVWFCGCCGTIIGAFLEGDGYVKVHGGHRGHTGLCWRWDDSKFRPVDQCLPIAGAVVIWNERK